MTPRLRISKTVRRPTQPSIPPATAQLEHLRWCRLCPSPQLGWPALWSLPYWLDDFVEGVDCRTDTLSLTSFMGGLVGPGVPSFTAQTLAGFWLFAAESGA
jgi:hypothetical protein